MLQNIAIENAECKELTYSSLQFVGYRKGKLNVIKKMANSSGNDGRYRS